MKISKISLIIASSTILIGCGGTAPIVSTPIASIDALPLKTIPLTDSQTKNWGAYDLSRDTIPGMSVDRAYSEIIKNKKGITNIVLQASDKGVSIYEKMGFKKYCEFNIMWMLGKDFK